MQYLEQYMMLYHLCCDLSKCHVQSITTPYTVITLFLVFVATPSLPSACVLNSKFKLLSDLFSFTACNKDRKCLTSMEVLQINSIWKLVLGTKVVVAVQGVAGAVSVKY